MAFRSKLQNYKLGSSGLGQTSSEELQGLTDASERPIAPQSPLESSVIGASPDVAKMAGTPNQKTSSLRIALQQSNSLPDSQRVAQSRTQQTGQEQQTQAKGQSAQKLDQLNTRVQALTNNMLQTAESQTTAQMTLKPDALANIAPENQQETTALLGKLGNNTATNQDILRLNQLMGKTDVASQLTGDQIKANFMTAGNAAGTALANNTADTIKVSDIDPTSLGFQDMNELANVLGVDPTELAGLSLKDLQDDAQKLFTDEFNKTNTLTARANDINLGPAERAEARKDLKDMGATGVAKSETGIDKLADQVANADTINFAGEDLNVKDVLSDEYLSGLAAHYVDSDETDPFRAELKASEPELAKWLDDNQEVLKQATQSLDDGVKAFSDLQFQNQKLKSFPDLPDLSDDVMKSILPDYGSLRADAYNIDDVPALKYMQDVSVPQASRANVRSAFDVFNTSTPQLTGQLAKLSPQQLDQLGATGGPGNTKWQAVTSYLKDVSNINSVNQDQPDTIASYIMGPGTSFTDLVSMAKDAKLKQNMGMFGSNPLPTDFMEILRDGDPQAITQYLKDKFIAPSDLGALVNQTPFSASQSGQLGKAFTQQTNDLVDLVAPYMSKSAVLQAGNITDLARRDPLGLQKVFTSELVNKMTPDARAGVQDKFNTSYTPEYSQKLQQANFFSLPEVTNLANSPVGSLSQGDVTKLSGTLAQMKSELKAANSSTQPLEVKFLLDNINKVQSQVDAHQKDLIDKLTKQIALSNPKDGATQLKNFINSSAPGASDITSALARALGINDSRVLGQAATIMGNQGVSFLTSLQSLDLAGNAINQATNQINSWTGGNSQKKVAETAGAVGNAISGCFVKGTKFLLNSGILKSIEDISVHDTLWQGGQTYATAQFLSNEIYKYNDILVAGSHAVWESSGWVRVKDSNKAVLTDLKDVIVYVVWNQEHLMIHESGVIFADYAETDTAGERIKEMKNIAELNNKVIYA